MSKIDYSVIGKRFGRLTVMDFDKTDTHASKFICKCDCGNIKSIRGSYLKSGKTTSCGCKKHERRAEDLTGKRFGRLQVTGFNRIGDRGKSYWDCICDCGNKIIAERSSLICGHTMSCGCKQRDAVTKHGMSNGSLYKTWQGMKRRCTNPNHEAYDRYGGRGIGITEDWYDFEKFRDWAINNGYKENLTIDRINNDDGYCPENCRWTDWITQNNNTRWNRLITYNNITHTVADWSRILNIKYKLLYDRINVGDMRDFENYFKFECAETEAVG